MNVLELCGISKNFSAKNVLNDLCFNVPENSIFGFIGENGAGKTTTMKLILGLMKPDSGEIRVQGERVSFGSSSTNRNIGYLPDVPEFYDFPFPIATSNEEMLTNIKNYDQKSYFDKVNRYFERYPLYDDGNASRRVVDWLEKKIKEKK